MSFTTTAGLRILRVRVPFSSSSHGFASPLYHPILFARAASSSTATATATAASPVARSTTTTEPKPPSLKPTTTTYSPLLNPPSSTRPPPLDLPTRDPSTSYISYLYHLGKAYTSFYKSGFKAVFTNRRLLNSSPSPTRAHILLHQRVRHDLSRVPLFGLLVLVCGELTPFIVLLLPQLTPYTCRIPSQVAVLRRTARARRARAQRYARRLVDNYGVERAAQHSAVDGHVCRVLGLSSGLWDRVRSDGPFAGARARGAVGRLVRDDRMIREGGGVAGLEDAEVVWACEERGMDVGDRQEQEGGTIGELRAKLGEWVGSTEGLEGEAAEEKVRRMLLLG
ncbi:hypothetical protein F4810DRAFT_720600 [Camillea tinctor]|nr:hypothetical protein F4810DRAFT_720600 [Camillea tinctor]